MVLPRIPGSFVDLDSTENNGGGFHELEYEQMEGTVVQPHSLTHCTSSAAKDTRSE